MPAPGQTTTGSSRDLILTWLRDHPGQHRPAEVSTGLGVEGKYPRMSIHNEVARLHREGLLTRTSLPVKGRKRPVTTYALAPASVGG